MPARKCGANWPGLGPLFAAALLAFFSQAAWAGRVHPELDAQLSALPPGQAISVIVEMSNQADPVAAAASAPQGQRMARRRAVRDRLQILANQDQAAILALLTREQSLGNVQRLRRFWVFNGLAVTASEAVIRRLAERADVREIRPDSPIPVPPPIRLAAIPHSAASVTPVPDNASSSI